MESRLIFRPLSVVLTKGTRLRSLQRADGCARVYDEASGRRQIRARVKSSPDGGPTGPKEERSGAEKNL